MKFWDSSALVSLFFAEAGSTKVQGVIGADPDVVVWWASRVECASAVCRLERERKISSSRATEALETLDAMSRLWREVEPSEAVRIAARRLLLSHPLRAGDSLQLAAALVMRDGAPAGSSFVCLDQRLADAARREGFAVLPAS